MSSPSRRSLSSIFANAGAENSSGIQGTRQASHSSPGSAARVHELPFGPSDASRRARPIVPGFEGLDRSGLARRTVVPATSAPLIACSASVIPDPLLRRRATIGTTGPGAAPSPLLDDSRKLRDFQAFSAPERSRTSTTREGHKALNLARLPVPPQAPEGSLILVAVSRRPRQLASVRRRSYYPNRCSREGAEDRQTGDHERWTST